MPAKKERIKINGIDEARKKLKDIGNNAIQERQVVNSAKKAGDPTLRIMKRNLLRVPVGKTGLLTTLLGKKKIGPKYGGRDFPGAWIGLKNKNAFTIGVDDGMARRSKRHKPVLSIYWIEYGTSNRKQKTTGRATGGTKAYAPLRKAISTGISGAQTAFRNMLLRNLERYVNKKKK